MNEAGVAPPGLKPIQKPDEDNCARRCANSAAGFSRYRTPRAGSCLLLTP